MLINNGLVAFALILEIARSPNPGGGLVLIVVSLETAVENWYFLSKPFSFCRFTISVNKIQSENPFDC